MKIEIKSDRNISSDNPNWRKVSQLRQDLVTGDWVVIATNRSRRPADFVKKRELDYEQDKNQTCCLCYPEETGQAEDVLIYEKENGNWSLRVFPNRYPAFQRTGAIEHFEEGPYFAMESVGYHELVVTRDHEKSLALLDSYSVAEVVDAYQERYLDLMNKKSVKYIEIFHNHGRLAGASLAHPHSQIMAIPVISPYVDGELSGAEKYYRANRQCVYCTMLEWERESGKRVIYANDKFLVFCPFASRSAFEMWIAPLEHQPYFERMNDDSKLALGEALQKALKAIYDTLDNPDYNFYLHTSPCDGNDYAHFHWHIEILPRTSTWAGFELSTGIEISTILPELAANYLREKIHV